MWAGAENKPHNFRTKRHFELNITKHFEDSLEWSTGWFLSNLRNVLHVGFSISKTVFIIRKLIFKSKTSKNPCKVHCRFVLFWGIETGVLFQLLNSQFDAKFHELKTGTLFTCYYDPVMDSVMVEKTVFCINTIKTSTIFRKLFDDIFQRTTIIDGCVLFIRNTRFKYFSTFFSLDITLIKFFFLLSCVYEKRHYGCVLERFDFWFYDSVDKTT